MGNQKNSILDQWGIKLVPLCPFVYEVRRLIISRILSHCVQNEATPPLKINQFPLETLTLVKPLPPLQTPDRRLVDWQTSRADSQSQWASLLYHSNSRITGLPTERGGRMSLLYHNMIIIAMIIIIIIILSRCFSAAAGSRSTTFKLTLSVKHFSDQSPGF